MLKKLLEKRRTKKEQLETGRTIDKLKEDRIVLNAAAVAVLWNMERGEDSLIDRGLLKRMKKALVPFHADKMAWK